MKKQVSKGLLAILIMSMVACSGNTQSETAQSENGQTVADNTTLADAAVATVVDAYLGLKDALVASDDQKAQETAQALLAALEGNETQSALTLRKDAEAILQTSNLEQQRAHFDHLSEQVYSVVKSSDGVKKPLYKQYCPMAFDNEGAYWLSDKEEVRNPYFGDAMLTCGRVDEKLN